MFTLEEFLEYVYEGREFEFSLNNVSLFMYYKMEEYNGKEEAIWYIYDVSDPNNSVEIFHGTEDNMLNFDFGNNIAFNNSIESFKFECIL